MPGVPDGPDTGRTMTPRGASSSGCPADVAVRRSRGRAEMLCDGLWSGIMDSHTMRSGVRWVAVLPTGRRAGAAQEQQDGFEVDANEKSASCGTSRLGNRVLVETVGCSRSCRPIWVGRRPSTPGISEPPLHRRDRAGVGPLGPPCGACQPASVLGLGQLQAESLPLEVETLA